MNANSDSSDGYAYFGPGIVNEGNANSYNELFNSTGDENYNAMGARPVASINCGCNRNVLCKR